MGTFSAASSQAVDELANFIPEIWSDDVIAAFKSNLVMGNLVTRIDHQGKKGDTLHFPNPARDPASAKAANTSVTLTNDTAGVIDVFINKHFEWSQLIEDIAELQAKASQRMFYTDQAGHALAKIVDWHLHVLGTGLQGATVDSTSINTPGGNLTYNAGAPGVGAVIGSDGTTQWDPTGAGNGTALADAGIRKIIQTLDDVDVPMSGRYLVVPPVERKSLMGLSRFTEQAFVGEVGSANTIRNGLIGDIYGVEVFVSTNAGATTDAGGTNSFRAAIMFHRSALVLVIQMAVRSQVQYKQEFLSDLFTADTVYGTGELRDDGGVAIIVPA